MTKKRKGSVLLQTLVMCIVLSYVAVSLTKWGLSRYYVTNSSYTSSAANLEGSAGVNVYFSKMPTASNIPCTDKTYNQSPNAFKYSLKCSATTSNVNKYEFDLSGGNKSTNTPF